MSRGELHLFKDTVEVEAAKTVTGKYAVIWSDEPNQAELASVQGNTILGVALWDGTAGDQVTIVKSGLVRVYAGAAVTKGLPVMVDATGRFIAATAGEHVVGFAMEGASGAGELFEIDLYQSGYVLEGFGDSDSEFSLNVDILDISSAGSVWVVTPWACTIDTIYTVIDGAIATADAGITAEIGGTLVTGSAITIANAGSAAGDVDSASPSAANVLAAGGAVEIITDGASTNAVKAMVTLLCTRTA